MFVETRKELSMEVIEFGLKQRDETNPYLVPAIIYGKEMENIPVALDRKELKQMLKKNGKNVIMNCTLPDGKVIPTVIKEIQQDVVTFEPFHVDFMALRKDQKITITVPVRLENKEKCAGIKNGGKLQFVLFKVKIAGKPEDLPRELHLDITNLDIGEIIYTRDLPLNEGVTMVSPSNLKVVGFYTRSIQVEEELAAAEAAGGETPIGETPQEGTPAEAKEE
jgi:large subunit ribosomal protein L25